MQLVVTNLFGNIAGTALREPLTVDIVHVTYSAVDALVVQNPMVNRVMNVGTDVVVTLTNVNVVVCRLKTFLQT